METDSDEERATIELASDELLFFNTHYDELEELY